MSTDHYKQAGVDIEAGDTLVQRIKTAVTATQGPAVRGPYGHYGALFSIKSLGADGMLLVSGTDGVGTKLELTKQTGRWDTIGQDLVAMCANDILCLGARPLFFLDYYATGKLQVDQAAAVINGIAHACKAIGCALIGGETAEMPGLYQAGDFDLAGFIVGAVHEKNVIDGSQIQVGDHVLGLSSSGFHSNGYSLVRHLIKQANLNLQSDFDGQTLAEYLLTPTRLYGPLLEPYLSADYGLRGLAHITGGGLLGNVPRILPDACQLVLDRHSWERPRIFDYFQTLGQLPDEEMLRVFNDGIGMVLVVQAETSAKLRQALQAQGEKVWDLGVVAARPNGAEAVVMKS